MKTVRLLNLLLILGLLTACGAGITNTPSQLPTVPVSITPAPSAETALRGFLDALPAHLEPGGEGWLILSDLAEHLGLRTRPELLAAFAAVGLQVVARSDARPNHPRVSDATDPLHAARAAEVTSLWRLAVR